MKVFDFDGTIYDGDSSLDFYFFCLRKKLSVLLYVPMQVWAALGYIVRIYSKTQFKERFFCFLKAFSDIDTVVTAFWITHTARLKPILLELVDPKSVIISASPEFLLKPVVDSMNTGTLLATRMDKKCGRITGKNCFGAEKISRFKTYFGDDAVITDFYSDSTKDKLMADMANHAFFVEGHKVTPWFDIYRK